MTAVTAQSADDYSTYSLVRRLLVDEALRYWPRYAIAFVLMGVAAAATALTAYLLGSMTNEAYVNRNYHGIVVIGLSRHGDLHSEGICDLRVDRVAVVDRQFDHRREPAADVRQAVAAEYRLLRRPPFLRIHRPPDYRRRRRLGRDQSPHHGDRPRSDVADRPLHRDGDPGSDHVDRRLHHGAAGLLLPAQADPPRARHRAAAVHRRHAHHRNPAGSAAGHAHGQGFRPGRRDAAAARQKRRRGSARVRTRWRGSRTAPAR